MRHFLYRLTEHYYEARYHVSGQQTLYHEDPEYMEHTPIPFCHLFAALRRIDIGPHDVFFDYGCGSGRALVCAATLPFRRVEGVELDSELASTARANLTSAWGLRCRNWHISCADATKLTLPDDVTVAYFYNPFRGSVLDRVIERLRESLERNPRHVSILFFNRADWSRATRNISWIRTREEISFSYPRIGCGIYDCQLSSQDQVY